MEQISQNDLDGGCRALGALQMGCPLITLAATVSIHPTLLGPATSAAISCEMSIVAGTGH